MNSMDKSNAFLDEYPAKGTMTVFNDASNPLLSQVAIFARLLEQSQIERKNALTSGYGDASLHRTFSAQKSDLKGDAGQNQQAESSQPK